MAETKTNTVVNKKEKIFIPKGLAGDDPNLYVSVNGEAYLLPRGKESEVPAHIAAEIRRSWVAEEARDRKSDELLEQGKEPIYKI
jgi:hypothetical protein